MCADFLIRQCQGATGSKTQASLSTSTVPIFILARWILYIWRDLGMARFDIHLQNKPDYS